MSYCSNCGAQVNEEAKFCSSCGQPIQKVESAENNNVVDSETEEELEEYFEKKPFYKRYWLLIAIVVLIFAMAVTVPDKQAHVRSIKSEFMEAVAQTENKNAEMMAMFGNSIIDKVLDSQLHVDNYLLFSVGKIITEEEEKTISFGVLTHVFVGEIDKDKLNESLE